MSAAKPSVPAPGGFCSSCGAPIASGAHFCVECGATTAPGAAKGRSPWLMWAVIGAVCALIVMIVGIASVVALSGSNSATPPTGPPPAAVNTGSNACTQFWAIVKQVDSLSVADTVAGFKKVSAAAVDAPPPISRAAAQLAALDDVGPGLPAAWNGMVEACNAAGFTYPN